MADNKQAVERVIRTFNNHDAEAVVQLYTEDATYMLPGEPDPLRGRDAIKESYEMFFRAFPDMSSEILRTMASGEHAFAECVVRGTHTGPLKTPEGEVEPTDKKIEFGIAFVCKVTPDGLIAEDWTYFDSAVMMSQLGLAD